MCFVVLSADHAVLGAVCLCAADADICCDDCSTVFYCALQDVHDKECNALEEVDLIAAKTRTDVDLLRLLIRILVARSLDAADGKLCVDNEGIVKAFYANVQDLVHVLDKEEGMWVDHVHAGANMIMGNLPDECQLPVKEVIVIAAQINENSYSLNALDEKHLVGLFSICGLIRQRGQMLETVSWKFEHCVILTEKLTLSYIDTGYGA